MKIPSTLVLRVFFCAYVIARHEAIFNDANYNYTQIASCLAMTCVNYSFINLPFAITFPSCNI
jgi:hypothetical protein